MDPIVSSAIIGSAGQAVNVGANSIIGALTAEQSRKRNYYYNELAAENAKRRQIELYNAIQSPQALVEQYKKAGLSPSLMFGGTPGQGTASASMGAGPTGPQTPFMPVSMLEGAQAALTLAQTKKTEAETRTIEGENDRGAAEIEAIIADTAGKYAAANYNEALTTGQNIANYVADKTKEYDIETVEHMCDMYRNEADMTYWQALDANIQFDFNQETYESRVEQQKNESIKSARDILLEDEQIQLTKSQRKAVEQGIQQAWQQLKLKAEELAVSKATLKQRKNEWRTTTNQVEQQLRLQAEGLNIQKWEIGVGAATKALGAGAQIAAFKGIKGDLKAKAAGQSLRGKGINADGSWK